MANVLLFFPLWTQIPLNMDPTEEAAKIGDVIALSVLAQDGSQFDDKTFAAAARAVFVHSLGVLDARRGRRQSYIRSHTPVPLGH